MQQKKLKKLILKFKWFHRKTELFYIQVYTALGKKKGWDEPKPLVEVVLPLF